MILKEAICILYLPVDMKKSKHLLKHKKMFKEIYHLKKLDQIEALLNNLGVVWNKIGICKANVVRLTCISGVIVCSRGLKTS